MNNKNCLNPSIGDVLNYVFGDPDEEQVCDAVVIEIDTDNQIIICDVDTALDGSLHCMEFHQFTGKRTDHPELGHLEFKI